MLSMKRMYLDEARRKARLTQTELADRVGCRQSYISKLENGVVPEPPVSLGLAFARVLAVDVAALRFGPRTDRMKGDAA
jgi:transcriptional regulator with XRE-family HTH domain